MFPRREIGFFFFSLLLAEAEAAEGRGPLETGGDSTRSMSFPPLFFAPTLTFFSIPFTRRRKIRLRLSATFTGFVCKLH